MLKSAYRVIILALVWLTASSVCTGADAPKGRAVSLNALVGAVRSGSSPDAANLCGVTQVLGYTIDSKSGDVIIVGKVDPSLPKLYFDDLVVALRNAWIIYYELKGNVRYYSSPGCSIDPDPKVLRELNDVQAQMPDLSDDTAVQTYVANWKAVGEKPQNVRVMGVPFDSRFSKVMVDADFYMKRLVNGTVTLGVDGFDSLCGMRAKAMREDYLNGTSSRVPSNSLSRFWFTPGEVTYEEKSGMIFLRECSVHLLTEEEFLSEQNEVRGMGRPDPMAGAFAQSFSVHYSDIAAARPIYTELQSLFRFVGLARLMKDDRADKVSKSTFDYLLNKHKTAVVPVYRAVKGLADVQVSSEVYQTPNGLSRVKVAQSFCGGVSMDVRPKRVVRAPSATVKPVTQPATPPAAPPVVSGSKPSGPAKPGAPVLTRPKSSTPAKTASVPAKNVVLSARKSTKQISWDVPLDALD